MTAMIESINPATGDPIASYEATSREEALRHIEVAVETFGRWKETPMHRRGELLLAAANVLRNRRDEFARLMALEMGKPIAQGQSEAEKCAWACEYYAGHAEAFLAPRTVPTDAAHSFITYQPLGPLLAVMPWNFPFWQVFRCAAPAVMAGNPVLLKHASNVPGCALAIERIFREAGFPHGMFTTLLVDSSLAGDLIDERGIRAVTLTGSVPAGRSIAARAGHALKKTVLELGGSDAYLILEDADLESAASACTTARLINGGQSCIAAKRFIVIESVREAFEELLVRKMTVQKMGDPLDPATEIGPMARNDLRDELHDQVVRSLRDGARLLAGGEIPDGPGAYYPPTVLTECGPGMAVWDEETFGPVAAVAAAPDEDTAIHMANDSVFGLGAAVFTADRARGERIAAERLEAGSCFVNSFVRSDPRLPFGGIKDSGYGRELSAEGIREFMNVKTVYAAEADPTSRK
jgi:succinate-semialdehyde dehydrogenase/glutarate-semialdehyde dehydrogenase